MFNQSVDVIGTLIIIVAPIAIVIFLILVVVAYPWLLIVALVIWYLIVRYVPDEVARTGDARATMSDGQESRARDVR